MRVAAVLVLFATPLLADGTWPDDVAGLTACLEKGTDEDCLGQITDACIAAPARFADAASSNQKHEWCIRAETAAWQSLSPESAALECGVFAADILGWIDQAICLRDGIAATIIQARGPTDQQAND